jgi:sentrin-specific protease 7
VTNCLIFAAEKKVASVQIGNTTITPMKKDEIAISVVDDEGSERDEAEGDESELESEEEEEVIDQGQPVKV